MVQKGIDEDTGKTSHPLKFQSFRRVLAGRKTRHICTSHLEASQPKTPPTGQTVREVSATQENTAHDALYRRYSARLEVKA